MLLLNFPTPESFIAEHQDQEASCDSLSYNGNCHCGRFRFRLMHPRIWCAFMCTCSLCEKQGGLWLVPEPSSFEITRDEGALVSYTTPLTTSQFCGMCGTLVMGKHYGGSHTFALLVNIRALQDVNPFDLRIFQTSAYGDLECRKPKTMAPEPGAPGTHSGSCHCGRVRFKLLAPLEQIEVREDNCSICVRNAWLGAYPRKDQVMISGWEYTRDYQYGRRYTGFPFCATCGIHVYNNLYGPARQVLNQMPADMRAKAMEMVTKNLTLQPINVRVLDGVDLSSIKVKRRDGGTEGYVLDP